MIVVGFLLAMDILGIDLTALAFFSGAFGLAIGFGLQKTFGNLISGIILLMDRSIKPGDVIAIGDSFGWVNKIGIRAVSIITRDGKEHLIPNENMMTNEVENWSYSSKNVRVRIPVGVAYNSDIKLVEKILLELAKDHSRILKRPEPKVLIKEFGDNSVNFEYRIWIKDPQAGVSNIKSDIMKQIWFEFEEHGVEFPFPQRDVHLDITKETLAALKKIK
jgi:small-conductance mechanosensitive channel